MQAATLIEAFRIVRSEEGKQRRVRLMDNILYLRSEVERVGRPRPHTLHRHGVETRHGGACQGGEEQRAAGHNPTVRSGRARSLEAWGAWAPGAWTRAEPPAVG